MSFDPRIDTYIENAADFAQPILRRIREVIHEVCPDVEETMKWSFPHFEYKGPFMHMASFKEHVAMGYWKAKIMADPAGIFGKEGFNTLSQMGKITSLEDLPDYDLIKMYIEEAMDLNDRGVKLPSKPKKDKKDLVVPKVVIDALKTSKSAKANFESFSYSHQKEYVDWITGAKRDETREKRLRTMIEWLEEGKHKEWKYEKKN